MLLKSKLHDINSMIVSRSKCYAPCGKSNIPTDSGIGPERNRQPNYRSETSMCSTLSHLLFEAASALIRLLPPAKGYMKVWQECDLGLRVSHPSRSLEIPASRVGQSRCIEILVDILISETRAS
jgi:hypothetical protein